MIKKIAIVIVPLIIGSLVLAGWLLTGGQINQSDSGATEPPIQQEVQAAAEKAENIRQQAEAEQEEAGTAVTLIIKGKKDPLEFKFEITDKTDAFNLLKQVATNEDIVLKYSESAFGVFVEQIGNTKNSGSEFWLYYINGEFGKIASDKQVVKPGDIVEWRYE